MSAAARLLKSFLPGLLLFSCFAVAMDSWASTEGSRKRILILYPYENNMPGFIAFDAGFRAALRTVHADHLDIYIETMDVLRFPAEDYENKLVELYHEKYDDRNLDLVIACLWPSLDFLNKYKGELFQGAPVLLVEYDLGTLRDPDGLESEIALVKSPLEIENTLSLALELHPETQRVFVISGASLRDQFLEAEAREVFRTFENRVEFSYLSGLPLEDVFQRVSRLPDRSLIFFLSFQKDGSGKPLLIQNSLPLIAERANAPIYGISETYLGLGVLGGRMIDFSALGAHTAHAALRVLQGEEPGLVRVGPLAGSCFFDARQMERWGIKESRLPAGCAVRYKKFSLWESYRWQVFGVAAVVVLQTALISLLLTNLRRRRLAEQALREAELKYRTVANFTQDWEYWQGQGGRMVYISPACEQLSGYTPRHFTENPSLLNAIVFPEDREAWEAHVVEEQSGTDSMEIQFRIVTQEGKVRWIDHVCRPVTDAGGNHRGIRVSNRDITERKEMQEEIQRRQEELAHMTRLVTTGELATLLAHEMFQPLTAILCNAEAAQRFIASESPDLEEIRQILDDIVKDDKRAGEVIRRMRSLVKKGTAHREEVDLNDTIRESLELIRSTPLMQGVSVTTRLEPRLPHVNGDPIQLQQVILNLLLNAVAAMSEGPAASKRLIIETTVEEGRTARVSVRDSGPGIDENLIDRIFEPFYTTKAGGLGMGLAITRTILSAHGGSVWAGNNAEGDGATVVFALPLCREGE